MRVLIFGDSIAYGSWDTEGGWVERLKKKAHRITVNTQGNRKIQIINLGIGGDTSTKILKRLKTEIDARYSPNWPLLLVFSFTTNDERKTTGTIETPIELFEKNVSEIIKTAKQHSSFIFFVGTPPLATEIVEFKGVEYSDKRIREYEAVLKNSTKAAGIGFVSIRSEFSDKDDLFCYDNLHPNNKGHEIIANKVWPVLGELLR
jgi:lysophospholipase L1-like esterase